MRSKIFSAAVLASSLIFTNQLAVANTPTPAFVSPDGRQVPYGHWQYFFTPSYLLPLSYIPSGDDVTDQRFSSVLPPCDGNQQACIEKVEYQLNNGDWLSATSGPDQGQRTYAFGVLAGANNWKIKSSSTFAEDLTLRRPQGATARLWNFDGAPHAAGSGYQVAARFEGQVFGKNPYVINSFSLQVLPVTRVPGNGTSCQQPSIFEEMPLNSNSGYCKTIYDFPENVRVRVTLKLGTFITDLRGWFDGRLGDALIKIDQRARTVQIEGAPLIVPSASNKPMKYAEIPKGYPAWPNDALAIATQNAGPSGMAGFASVNNPFELDNFIGMGETINETATGQNTMWLISSIVEPGNNPCLQPGILNGIVLTNATVYNASAPKWSADNSSLDFRVAATHFNPKGELFKGYYKLLVSEKVASCYWGPDFSKGSASISITNQDGTTGVATTNLGLRDGWVNFEAAGFTFSSPTISAIIKKAPVVAPTPTPTPSPTPTATQAPIAKKKTITCIAAKKKSVKVVGLNPKCPKGFKKK